MALAPYATPGQRIWFWTFRTICVLILLFLILPILVVIPLSFNATNFFTFTPEMLALDPAGFSLRHYQDFFTNPDWQNALWNSVRIAPGSMIETVTPCGASSMRRASLRASTAYLLAWYQPPSGSLT